MGSRSVCMHMVLHTVLYIVLHTFPAMQTTFALGPCLYFTAFLHITVTTTTSLPATHTYLHALPVAFLPATYILFMLILPPTWICSTYHSLPATPTYHLFTTIPSCYHCHAYYLHHLHTSVPYLPFLLLPFLFSFYTLPACVHFYFFYFLFLFFSSTTCTTVLLSTPIFPYIVFRTTTTSNYLIVLF